VIRNGIRYGLPVSFSADNANEDVKRTLALPILRLADRGERDPIPVADAAFSELAGSDRSAIGDVRKRVSAWAARRAGGALPL
jgi:hypothetical protein